MSERLRAAGPRLPGRGVRLARPCTTRRWRSSTPATPGSTTQRLVALIGDRISFVPRYRQRVQPVPGRLANPVWVDDPHFDLGFHVRRSALPRPGTMDQLRELVARIVSRPLDRHRPLWEVYFVEGLADGRVAVLSKSPPGARRRHRDRRPRAGAARRRRRASASSATTTGGRRADPPPTALVVSARPRRRCSDPAPSSTPCAATPDPRVRAAEAAANRAGAVTNALTNRRPGAETPISGELSQQRRFVAGPHRPRGLPQGAPGARRHDQRRHPRHHHRRPARPG